MFSFPECITWLAVGLAMSVAIVTLNIITIIVFVKNRNLRKRSTYLVINLAVVDVLAGGFATYELFYVAGVVCDVWRQNVIEQWAFGVVVTLLNLFPICSLTNITAISIERLHATLRPFRHRIIKKWVYGLIIAVVWVTAGMISVAIIVIILKFDGDSTYFYLRNSFIATCLLVICVSYSSIVVKVRCGAQPQHHGAASRERKLTMTLLIMTVVSLLLYLPYILFLFLRNTTGIFISMSLLKALSVLLFANSLVNPILYAIRMPEYRSAVRALFRRRPQQQRQIAIFPLHDM
ncbi:histamine H2 receptor-like [Oculina patagonica]